MVRLLSRRTDFLSYPFSTMLSHIIHQLQQHLLSAEGAHGMPLERVESVTVVCRTEHREKGILFGIDNYEF